jgi:hypothetical protein
LLLQLRPVAAAYVVVMPLAAVSVEADGQRHCFSGDVGRRRWRYGCGGAGMAKPIPQQTLGGHNCVIFNTCE